MSKNNGITPRTKKHSSRTNSASKRSRVAFHKLSETSSLSSNRNSSAQSEDDARIHKNMVNKANGEDKDSLLKKLAAQVKELKHKIKVLEECVDNKDYSLAILTREKDRALGEIRRLERSNRQLKQQLNDERNYYIEEKEKFCEEMSKHKKRFRELKFITESGKSLSDSLSVVRKTSAGAWQKGDAPEIRSAKGFFRKLAQLDNLDYLKSHSLINLSPHKEQDLTLQLAALQMENAKLRGLVNDGEEKNYELCLRFLRMKHSKRDLRIRFRDLENEYLQIINNLMEKIDEAREEFNVVVDQKCKKPTNSNGASAAVRAIRQNSKINLDKSFSRTASERPRRESSKEGAQGLTAEALNGINSHVDRKSSYASETKKRLDDVKSKDSTDSEGMSFGTRENSTQKSSETDSNCMTKSSTLDRDAASAELKSTKIVLDDFERGSAVGNRAVNPKIHMLSEDILHKLFKRIDSQLSMGNTKETQNDSKATVNLKDKKRQNSFHDSEHSSGGKYSGLEKKVGKKFIMCCMNSKKFHEITRPIAKIKESNTPGKSGERQPMPESPKSKRKPDKLGRCKTDIIGLAWDGRIRARWKPKAKGCYTDAKEGFRSRRSSGKSSSSPIETRNVKDISSWSHVRETLLPEKENKNFSQISSTPRLLETTEDAEKRELICDSCGLQEKLDSDFETSAEHNKIQSARNESGEKSDKGTADEPFAGLITPKCNTPKEEKEGMACHDALSKDDLATNSDDSTGLEKSSGRSGNENSITLYDELMEISGMQIQPGDDPFWQRAWNLQPTIAKSADPPPKRYWVMHQHSTFLSGNTGFLENSDEEEKLREGTTEDVSKEIQKGSERQIKRMEVPRSTSPSPAEANRKSVPTNSKNESSAKDEAGLSFPMERSAIESSQSLLSVRGESRRNSQHTFRSDRGKSSWQQKVQEQISYLALQTSNVPSSCSTVLDSSNGGDDSLTSRILSAPALLESEWLNAFTKCEMKDCSTNT